MIIPLRAVRKETRRFEFTLAPGWWQAEPGRADVVGLSGPVAVEMSLAKTVTRGVDNYVLDGRFSGRFRLRCARCLVIYEQALSGDFRLFLAPAHAVVHETEVELSPEDLAFEFIVGDEINLAEVTREQIYLALPMVSVCREGCRGLCPHCGADLNQGPCGCSAEGGHPGFAKLKALKLALEE